ncbi:hypothetical protein GCM10022381_39010 [Leifsonia kafniensis]|uniref:CU044_5270 family protein n=1 Tax=Leifsonia kafniensis TaxID=475957 RepID=A0ABP7L394_9MICO
MDDLTLLRTVRSDVAAPTDAVLTRGRAALFEKIAEEPGERIGAPSALAAPVASAHGRRTPRARRLRWAGFSTLGAGVLLTTLVLTNVLGFGGWRATVDPAAAAVLSDAAFAAIENSDPVVAPGQYLLVNTSAVYGATVDDNGKRISYLTINEDQVYLPADRSEEWVWKRNPRSPYESFGTESKRLALKSYDETMAGPEANGELLRATAGAFYSSPSPVSPTALAKFPSDPNELLSYIYRATEGGGQSREGVALMFIAEILRSGAVGADLRASFYQAAALIPGIEIVERQATLDGRTGIAIGRVENADHSRQDLIIDPATGLLIGERRVELEAVEGYPAGTATSWTAITTSVVDAAPDGGTPNGAADVQGCTLTAPGTFQC